MTVDRDQTYDLARRHGLSHEKALDAVAAERPLTCWCGSTDPCEGGAQRFIGCPVIPGTSPYLVPSATRLRRVCNRWFYYDDGNGQMVKVPRR